MADKILNRERCLKDIGLIIRDLLKVIKVVTMYPEGNPLPQSLRRSFAERLASLVEDYGDLKFIVNRNDLTYDGEVVFTDSGKEEGLASLFFEVGITSFTFKDGLDVPEIYKLLDVIKDYQNAHDRTQDLANKFWEANLGRFSFTTLEDIALAEYTGEFIVQEIMAGSGHGSGVGRGQIGTAAVENYNAIFNPGDSGRIQTDSGPVRVGRFGPRPGSAQAASMYQVESGEPVAASLFADTGIDDSRFKIGEAAEAMGFGSQTEDAPRAAVPNTALILNDEFKLSGEQEEAVAKLLSEDAQFDMYESTIELLKEMLLQESELDDFFETVTLCEKILHEFVHAGLLNEAGQILLHLKSLEETLHKEKPLWAERLKDARITAGSRDRLKHLVDALNQNSELGAWDMRRYLDHFGWESLGAVTDILGDLQHQAHRESLCDYLAAKGKENLATVARGMFDKRWFVVRNSITILARVGDARAIGYLKKAVENPDKRVRLELISALKDATGDEALELLKLCSRDSESEVRRNAVAVLVERHGQPAFAAITEIINDDQFLAMDKPEQQSLLNAFSRLGGEHAVEFLNRLISKVDLFHDPILAFFRKAAFEALTVNRSEKGERLLVKLSGSIRPDIRQQATAALKRRREILYGGGDEPANR